jgi:hypothetical protein
VADGAASTQGVCRPGGPVARDVPDPYATLHRIDAVFVRVLDADVDASDDKRATVAYTPGDPGPSPQPPVLRDTGLLLAYVAYPGRRRPPTVTDQRPWLSALGGVIRNILRPPRRSGRARLTFVVGALYRSCSATARVEVRSADGWIWPGSLPTHPTGGSIVPVSASPHVANRRAPSRAGDQSWSVLAYWPCGGWMILPVWGAKYSSIARTRNDLVSKTKNIAYRMLKSPSYNAT